MLLNLRRAFVISVLFLAFCGLGYSLAGTGLSLVFFRGQAEGSFVKVAGKVVGSTMIGGQAWPGPKWFQGRPDAPLLTNKADQVVVSGTQQWGPRSKALYEFVLQQAARLEQEGIKPTADLVTNSGSLLDPDISPADAYDQVPAVAKANHLPQGALRALVASHITGRELGFLGAPYVNVLELNIALAQLARHQAPVR
jgi:K+-transporting ATPase ATPase C chain